MKIINIIKISLLAVIMVFSTTACDKGFTELNVNPTQSDDLPPAFQLTRIMTTMSNNRYEYWRAQYIYTSCIIQHNASIYSYWSGDKYNKIDSYASALWDVSWTREIKNVVDLMARTGDEPADVNYNAAGQVLWVYMMARLTDLYGDLPYSEAGKGFLEDIISPKYDEQAAIYDDMLTRLANVTSQFDDNYPLEGDIYFGGDINKWKKWANSLRLKLGMRLTKVDPARAESEVKAAIAGGVMESNDDSAIMFHTDLERNGNSAVMLADDNFRMSKTLVDYLMATGDPRLPVWGMTYDDDGNANTDVSTWKGMPNGTNSEDLQEGEHATFVRHNRTTIKSVNSPYFHQAYPAVEFLLAEAAVRGWGDGDAAGHYAKALRAGCELVKLYPNAVIDEADIEDFVNANPLDESSAEASLEQINTGYWVHHYQDGMEAFANWRRTGYPVLTPVNDPIGTTGGTIPRRLYYPPSELANNGDNYTAAVQRQWGGDDDLTGRVWWDVQ